jgi:phage baseplate assembly protein W
MPSQLDHPFHFDHRGRTATTDLDDHIRDMIEQLLFTSPGERVNRPDFGSGLRQLVFQPNSPEMAAALQVTARAALERWLGDVIEISDFQAANDDASLSVSLAYVVRRTGTSAQTTLVRST